MQSPKSDQINLFTKQKHTRRHIKQTYGYQKGKGGLWDKLGVQDEQTTLYKIGK